MPSKGIARKACLIITFAITLPLCVAFYYFSEQQTKVILMENERDLTRTSVALAQRISHNGKPVIYWSDDFKKEGLVSERIAELNTYYQPLVDEIAVMYPNYRMGIYHRKLDEFIAVYPPSSQDGFISEDNPMVRKAYQTGESVIVTLASSNIDGRPVIVSISPIYHLGKIVGLTWAGKKIDNVLSESHNILIKGLIIILFLWLILILIVRAVFQKLDKSLMCFAKKIMGETPSPVEFRDFPQLEPLFDTVVNLREELKKETEHYLEESQTLKKLIELTPLVIFVVDKNGIIKDCNQAFLSYHPPYSRENIINLSYKVLTDENNRDIEDTVIIQALRGQECRDKYYYFLNRHWISSAFSLRSTKGEITGAIAICHDITEHEKLRKDMVRLDRLNIVGQMAASVAHEVRNPMTVVRGYIQSLLKKTGKTYSSQFGIIIEELDRANHIISNFLSLARDKYVEKKTESLRKIIQDILPLVESEALARHISCQVQLDAHLPLLLLNSEEIKQLILNLAMNALDAMEDIKQGELTISCVKNRKAADEIELKVGDTGCGMTQSEIEKVFEPFYTSKKNGSGLGLSVCKSIVERHGGYICVHSEKGKGSVFIISFPIEA